MKNKLFLCLLSVFLLGGMFSTLADDLQDKYINDAKGFYAVKKYDMAYSRIKFALNLYAKAQDIPKEVFGLAENIYYEYIKSLIAAGETAKVESIFDTDPNYPVLYRTSTKLQEQQLQYNIAKETKKQEGEIYKKAEEERKKLEAEKASQAKEEQARIEREQELQQLKKEKDAELARLEAENKAEIQRLEEEKKRELKRIEAEKTQAAEKERKTIEEKYQQNLDRVQSTYQGAVEKGYAEVQKIESELQRQRDENERVLREYREQADLEKKQLFEGRLADASKFVQTVTNNSFSMTIIIIIIIIIFGIVIFGIIFVNVAFMKNTQVQQQRYYEYSMKVIQQTQGNILSIPMDIPPALEAPAAASMRKLQAPAAAAGSESAELDVSRLTKVVETCKSYTAEIDEITHRKNCAKNVAELVYKISKHLGYTEYECMIFFAASLIYDIGFLSVDPRILNKEEVNEDEFEVIKTHTTLGLNMIHFIDQDLRHEFREAILKHHENLDGSGYPNALKDKEIPFVARVIRVVESFISLISSRRYRGITDKETAIKMLKKEKGKYDTKIVEALDMMV